MPVDVGITYALLLGGLALDSVALFMLLFSNRTKVYLEKKSSHRFFKWLARAWIIIKRWRPRRWSGTVAQFNLISYCLGVPDSFGGMRGCCLKVTKMLGAVHGLAELPVLQDFIFIHHQSLRIKYITEDFSGYIEESQILNTFFDSIKHTALQLTRHGDYMEIEKVDLQLPRLARHQQERGKDQRKAVGG